MAPGGPVAPVAPLGPVGPIGPGESVGGRNAPPAVGGHAILRSFLWQGP